jgi:hypothetical protein
MFVPPLKRNPAYPHYFLSLLSVLLLVNDTVVADPLFTVPILVSPADLQTIKAPKLSLCYEVHGMANEWFNFITDTCTNVNAHYTGVMDANGVVVPGLNVVDRIGVIAVNNDKECVEIEVNVRACTAIVEGVPINSQFRAKGISVRKSLNRVRVAVPNCAEQTLVMWVICEKRMLEGIDVDAIKFIVKRGLNFGHINSHGLIGMLECARKYPDWRAAPSCTLFSLCAKFVNHLARPATTCCRC